MDKPPRKTQITDAPAIVLTSGISVKNLRRGQMIPGIGAFLKIVAPTNRAGKQLGKEVVFFSATRDLSRNPTGFWENARGIGNLGKDWGEGHGGWKHDFLSYGAELVRHYEDALILGYEDRSSIGLYTMPIREVVDGRNRYGHLYEEEITDYGGARIISSGNHMFALHNNNEAGNALYDTFLKFHPNANAWYYDTCTADPKYGQVSIRIGFPSHQVHDSEDFLRQPGGAYYRPACVRPVVAFDIGPFDNLIIPRGLL